MLTDGHTPPLLLEDLKMAMNLVAFTQEYVLTIIDDERNVGYLGDFDLDITDDQYLEHGLPHDSRRRASELV